MKLSIVTTLYCSEPYVEEFYRRASAAAHNVAGEDYEIIMVNDGSPDNALEKAVALAQVDSHVTVVDLSRNFGHHKAMMTGLAHSTGERVFLIDSDLEESPEWLCSFAEQMDKSNCDVVYGVQKARKGGWFERISGALFHWIFYKLSEIDIRNIVTARLMTRKYIDGLLQHNENAIFIDGLWYITGFNQEYQYIVKKSLSATTYTLKKKFGMAAQAILSFSTKPLILLSIIGFIISLLAFIYAGFLIINKLFNIYILDGWTSVLASIWLAIGIILFALGLIGLYIHIIFIEVKKRPYAIEKEVYKRHDNVS